MNIPHNWIPISLVFLAIFIVQPVLCLFIFFILLITILSFGIAFFYYAKRRCNLMDREYSTVFEEYRFRPYLPELFQNSTKTNKNNTNSAITGSTKLDKIFDEIFDCLIHDFIDTWYTKLTSDRRFPNSLKRIASRTLRALCDRLRRVDFVALFTRYFVDDIACHVRLYRLSREKLAEQRRLFKANGRQPDDLESIFFDMELEMERGRTCRDLISTSPAYEQACLHDLTDLLLYLLLPSEDFRCRPFRFLIREILISKILLPVLNMLSDPDYLNHLIVWLLSNHTTLLSDDFLTILQTCESIQDLEAILEALKDEINLLHSKDKSGSSQEVQMLENVIKLAKKRMKYLSSRDQTSPYPKSAFYIDNSSPSNTIKLPITLILTNPIALSHFSKFLASVDRQSYLDLYLAIEGFTNSVMNQMRIRAGKNRMQDNDYLESIKEAATFIYHQFLSLNAITPVSLPEDLVNKYLVRMRTEQPVDCWFDHIQEQVVESLSTDRSLYPAFVKDPSYKKMLEELDIIDDENSDLSGIIESKKVSQKYAKMIIEVGMLGVGNQQNQNVFAVYNVRVKHTNNEGEVTQQWNVIRRYSDFYNLNIAIQQKFPRLAAIDFPGKKTFNNLKPRFLERRCKALNSYMVSITDPLIFKSNPGLEEEIIAFLSQEKYIGSGVTFPKKIVNAVFDPIFSGVKSIGNAAIQMPDQVFKMGLEFNKAAVNAIRTATNTKTPAALNFERVAANLDLDVDDNSLPLRVLILLVDEIFGLQSRNQWFRARIIGALRQFLNITYGQSLNRKIINFVRWFTSEAQIATNLSSIRDGLRSKRLYAKPGQKHPNQGPRNKILARYLMLSSVPAQLRFAFGTSATNSAVNNVSDILQHPTLNRRLCYVFFERIFISIFPKNNITELLAVLHSRSPRCHH